MVPRIEIVGTQRNPFLRRVAGQIVLRQVGPVARRVGIVAEHGQATRITATAQHFGAGEPGRAAAHDDDVFGPARGGGSLRCLRGGLDLFLHPDAVAVAFDRPARKRIEGGCAERFAGAQ